MRSRHGGIPTRLNRFLSASQLGSDIHCAILSADLAPSSARFEIFRITTVFVNAFNSVFFYYITFYFYCQYLFKIYYGIRAALFSRRYGISTLCRSRRSRCLAVCRLCRRCCWNRGDILILFRDSALKLAHLFLQLIYLCL